MDRKAIELRDKAFGKNGAAASGGRAQVDRCPLLGLPDDPETAFAFSTDANHCHKSIPPASVRLNHQQKYCLSTDYVSCPLFRQRSQVTLPGRRQSLTKRLSYSSSWSSIKALVPDDLSLERLKPYRVHFLVGWAVLLTGALILLLGWLNRGALADADPNGRPIDDRPLAALHTPTPEPSPPPATATPSRDEALAQSSVPATRPPTATPDASPTVGDLATATAARTEPPRPTESPTSPPASTPAPAANLCGPPAGWVLYTVQPGENLFRISLRYAASLDEMRRANCLTSNQIYAGQRIYVPYHIEPAPADTPTASPTPPPPQPPTATSQPPPTATPEPSPTSPLPTPTSAPPTATREPSSTSPPPTVTPAPPTPTPTPTPILGTPSVTRNP